LCGEASRNAFPDGLGVVISAGKMNSMGVMALLVTYGHSLIADCYYYATMCTYLRKKCGSVDIQRILISVPINVWIS
jgi:hypothetical protein